MEKASQEVIPGVPRGALLLATKEAKERAKGKMLLKAEEKATQEAR
ncbi:MAG: hypothetical protein ABIK97_00050 [candidate division WOR-3 bacterium]